MARATIIPVTPVMDTNIYAAADVAFVPIVVPAVARIPGGDFYLNSVACIDKDNQGVAIDLIFSSRSITLGTINAAVSVSDSDAAYIVGSHSILAADFIALVNSKWMHTGNLWKLMSCEDNSTDLYVSGIIRSGTPTFTASGLVLQLGFERF